MARPLACARRVSTRRVLSTLGACVAACAVMVGCATARPTDTERAAAPPDFTLSVTVGADAPGFIGARYVVEPGGAFRAAIGDAATPDHYPTLTRRLSRDETNALWLAAAALQSPAPIGSERALFERGAPVVVFVRASDAASVYAPDVTRDGAAAALLDQLEALAWVR